MIVDVIGSTGNVDTETLVEIDDNHIESLVIPNTEVTHVPPLQTNPGSLDGAIMCLRHVAYLSGLNGFREPSEVEREHLIIFEDGGAISQSIKAQETLHRLVKYDSRTIKMGEIRWSWVRW
jgi:hypothetical protein